MPKQVPNLFTSYELTDEEEREACILSSLTELRIRSLRAQQAEIKLMLKFDPANPSKFLQEESYCAGAIDAYTNLLMDQPGEIE